MSQAIMEVSDYLIEKANSPEAMKLPTTLAQESPHLYRWWDELR